MPAFDTEEYEIVEMGGARNTALAAGATEQLVAEPARAPYWNALIVQNFDAAVDTQILVDSGDVLATAASTGKLFRIQFNGGTLVIEPKDGLKFKQVVARNPHASTAQTENAIVYSWAYKRPKRWVF